MTDPINLPLVDVASLAINILDLTKAQRDETSFNQVELDIFREYTLAIDEQYLMPFAMAWTEMRKYAKWVVSGSWTNEQYINSCVTIIPLIAIDDIKGFNVAQLKQLHDIVLLKDKQLVFARQSKSTDTVFGYLAKIKDEIEALQFTDEVKIPNVSDLEKDLVFDTNDAFNATAVGLVQILVKAGVLHITDDGKATQVSTSTQGTVTQSTNPAVDAIKSAVRCLGAHAQYSGGISTPSYIRKYNTAELNLGLSNYFDAAVAASNANDIIIVTPNISTEGRGNVFHIDRLSDAAKIWTETSNVYIVNRSNMMEQSIINVYKTLGNSIRQKFIILG